MKRSLAATALVLGLGWFGSASAQPAGQPNPCMNRHYPFYVTCSYWAPCGFGFAGPTDKIWPNPQPVNGIGPPPFGPRPQQPQMPPMDFGPQGPQGQQGPQGGVPYYYYPGGQQQQPPPIVWSRFVRSPRDFFMVDTRR